MTDYFIQAFIYLFAAVITVPLAKRWGLGSVLGYLIAGVFIGPIFGLVGQETETIQHFAEFGVVMMLFLVGLELEPRMLWQMRHKLLGLGGLQLVLTAIALTYGGLFFGLAWETALAIGLILALSSTAIVLQTFSEKGLSQTHGARSAFSVLLFQDIAVIPMLALLPLLAVAEFGHHSNIQEAVSPSLSIVSGLSGWAYTCVVVGAIAVVVIGGHYLSRPLFKFVASAGLREVFTATALMLVVGIAALMSLVNLSPALGTFLAGVVLANSEFKHELESNIEPFKGLLLGLFFMTVGANINFSLLFSEFFLVLLLVLGLIVIKALVLLVLARLFSVRQSDGWLFALSLAQAGEFGFVLLAFTQQQQVIDSHIGGLLSLVVAISMFLTPGLFVLYDKYILPKYRDNTNQRDADDIDIKGKVIIAGIGRFGQIINRLLVASGVSTVVLDHQAQQVDLMRRINMKSFFGDATRPDLLHTAGIDEAALLVVAIDNKEQAVSLVEYVKMTYPHIKVFVRAYDRGHGYRLKLAGADFVVSETYYSALEMAKQSLISLGEHPFQARNKQLTFASLEAKHQKLLFELWRKSSADDKYSTDFKDLFLQLEVAMSETLSEVEQPHGPHRSWAPPPKDYQAPSDNH